MKRFIYSATSGLLLALSWPTYGFPFLLFVAFVPLLLLEHDITILKKEKRAGWKVFAFSCLTFSLWTYGATQWLHYSKSPDGSNSWLAFLFPLLVNTLLMSATFYIYHWVKRVAGTWYGIIFFPIFWICFEKFHLSWEMSWPWLNLGNAFANYPQVIQWYEATGTFGGTLWVLLVNMIVFYQIRAYEVTADKKYVKRILYYSLVIVGVPSALSFLYYTNYKEKSEQKIEVVLIQPKLDPYEDKYRLNGMEILTDLLHTADSKITPNTQFVVAPETAFPGYDKVWLNNLDSNPYMVTVKDWIKQKNLSFSFVSGVDMAEEYEHQKTSTARQGGTSTRWIDIYNASVQVNLVQPSQYYKKSKLVPGVEHFPYASVLKPMLGGYMMNFGGSMESMGVQEAPTVFTNPKNKARIAPTICYESIYGEFTADFVKKENANVIFIMTNDSWWDNSQGHKQLLAYARLRAIETRRDIARSANSGISAFINQRGDVVQSLPYDTKGALRGEVSLNSEKTLYSKYGDVIARLALLGAGVILAYAISKKILERIKK